MILNKINRQILKRNDREQDSGMIYLKCWKEKKKKNRLSTNNPAKLFFKHEEIETFRDKQKLS